VICFFLFAAASGRRWRQKRTRGKETGLAPLSVGTTKGTNQKAGVRCFFCYFVFVGFFDSFVGCYPVFGVRHLLGLGNFKIQKRDPRFRGILDLVRVRIFIRDLD